MGVTTSVIMWLIVNEGKNDVMLLFLTLFGATFGWISGMVFIFATGGLEMSLPWFILPAIAVALGDMIVLYAFRNVGAIFRLPGWIVGRVTSTISVVIVAVLILSIFLLAVPSYGTSINTQTYSVRDARIGGTMTLSSSQARAFNAVSTMAYVPITFDTAKSSVSFPRIAENPDEGQYLEFELTFSVSSAKPPSNWEQPYIGMCVFKDDDADGSLDAGEEIWDDLNYKGPTLLDCWWRSNCVYTTAGTPAYEMFTLSVGGDFLLAPMFHASSVSLWKADTSYTFPNTPQQYVPPRDGVSWEESPSGALTLKEQVGGYRTISAGSSATFKGKIYCPTGYAGTHGLLVRAFDARYTGPYTPNEDPLAEHVMTFTVGSGNGPVCGDGVCEPPETAETCPEDCANGGYPEVDISSTSWVTVAILGLATIGGAGAIIAKGPKLIK